jgi:uncharacterized protein (TIGR02646 family)
LAAEHARKFEAAGEAPTDFPGSHWRGADVLGALYWMQGRICAYCGDEIKEYVEGRVEHFRPKGAIAGVGSQGYWWLAYEFGNYFLSCDTCNSPAIKGSKFPLRTTDCPRITYNNRHDLPNERRLLPDPAVDAVDDWLLVDGTGFIKPRPHLPKDERERLEKAVNFFKLNERIELVRERVNLYDKMLDLLDQQRPTDVAKRALATCPHGIVAHGLLVDRAQAALPQPEARFEANLQRMVDEFVSGLRILEEVGSSEWVEKLLKIIGYALATAWLCPVAPWTSADVEGFLDRHGLRDFVEPRMRAMQP